MAFGVGYLLSMNRPLRNEERSYAYCFKSGLDLMATYGKIPPSLRSRGKIPHLLHLVIYICIGS
jgi:hypothetical protein